MWTMVTGEAFAALLALAPGPYEGRWTTFGLLSLVIQWVAFTTLGGLYLVRRRLFALKPLYVAQIALVFFLLSAWIIGILAYLLTGEVWLAGQPDPWALLARFSGIALIIGLLALGAYHSHLKASQMAVRAAQAELDALQARIHPHFFFNTLNAVAALVHLRPDDAERLLLDLTDIFRASLSGPQQVLLAEEIELTRRYVEIEALRFGARLRVQWHVPLSPPAVLVPTLCLQPLVENAIRHGIEASVNFGTVDIAVTSDESEVRLVVSNDVPHAAINVHRGHQVGLASTRARIQAFAPGRGALHAGPQGGKYVAIITLPLRN
jgi:two-component system sensor histidine kinase AlgZ